MDRKKRKVVFHLLLPLIAIVLLTACGIKIPKEMPDSVNIAYEKRIQLPLAATSVSVKDPVLGGFESVVEGLPLEATVSNWDPFTLKLATSLEYSVGSYLEDLDLGEVQQSFEVEVPGVDLGGVSISFDLPSLEDPDPINLPIVNASTSTTYEFSGFSELSFSSGDLVVGVEYAGATVSTLTIEIGSLGSVSFSNVSDGDVVSGSVDLSGKAIQSSLVATISATMEDPLTYGNATITLSFDGAQISTVSGIPLSVSRSIPKPLSVRSVEIGSGSAKLTMSGLSFVSASGELRYAGGSKSVGVDGGVLVVDLSGVTLPATFVLDGVDVEIADQSVLGSTVNGSLSFEDVVLSSVEIENPDLAVSTSVSLDLSGVEGVKRINLSSGYLRLDYTNTLPATINVRIWSSQLGIDRSVELYPDEASAVEVDLSGLTIDLEGADELVVSVAASPEGYDGSVLRIGNVELGEGFTLVATSSVRDLEIGSVVIAAQNLHTPIATGLNVEEALGAATRLIASIDTDSIPLEAKLWLDREGVDMDAVFTLHASWSGYSTDVTISQDDDYADISGLLKRIFKDRPSDLSLSISASVDEATITTDSSLTFGLDIEIPLEFTLNDDVELLSTDVSIPVNTSDVASMLEVLEAATFVAQMENDTGISVKATLSSAGKTLFSGTLGEESEVVIPVTSEDIEEILDSGSLHLELVLPSGDYSVNGEGVVSLVSWVDMLLDLETNVELSGKGGDGR